MGVWRVARSLDHRHGLRRVARLLVTLATVASTGVAVTLTEPSLGTRLGLVAATPEFVPAEVQPVLGPLSPTAPSPTPAGVAAALDPLLARSGLGRFGGMVVDPASRAVLWEKDSDRVFLPGSTAKILTAAATLLTLDTTHRLTTQVVAGSQPGTVVLVGGGDPTLTAEPREKDTVYPDPARLTELAERVKRAADGPIRRVLVDTSRYEGPRLAEGWLPEDVPGGYVAPIQALMLDGGRTDPRGQDSPRVDEPALAAGRALARLLGADPDAVATTRAPANAPVLATVYSAPVSDLVEHMMRTSDNVLAEVLAREVAIARGESATFTAAAEQILAALTQAGFDTSGAVLVDGSGLSTRNRVPARLLADVLAVAAAPAEGKRDTQFLRPIITGLPVAGGDGTLDDRFTGPAATGRGVVRAKTGTLTEVTGLAGVVTNADGRLLVFAFLSNGVSPAVARPRLDSLAAAVARCGCR